MSDNETRRAQRAASGLAKAIRHDFVRPDTQIVGPHGKIIILGRPDDPEHVPAFQKSNPERRHGGNQQQRVMTAAAVAAQARRGGGLGSGLGNKLLKGPMAALGRLPVMNLLVTAALVQRVWCFVTRRIFGDGPSSGGGRRRGDGKQLAKYGGQEGAYDDEDEDEDEFDMDERAEELLSQMQQSSMLPAMLRASLPRPQRTNLAKRAAQLHHSRPRDYRTAHQMMHGGPTGGRGAGSGAAAAGRSAGRRKAQRRPLGKLEKMDLIVRQQVRAAMLAQQHRQHHELQQLLLYGAPAAGPDGSRLALPAPAPSSSGQVTSGSGSGPASGSSARAGLGSTATSTATANASSAIPHRPPGSGTPDDQRQQQQTEHHEATQSALVMRPGPAGAAGMASYMPQLSVAPSPLAVPPPPFRPLPPDLRARMQGAPKPFAATTAPSARAAAAGPPPPPPPTLPLSSGRATQASPPAAASSDVRLVAAGSDAAEAGAGGLGERDELRAGPSRNGAQGSGGNSLALATAADCRVSGSDEMTVSVPRVARLAKGVRKAGSKAEGGV